ncbi:hypothetical protein [Leuconostoc pseudomesenteroides]|uniref:hypothetical protein n=1 Tax=Leuconostoc pseudomesenteroides TaxID=33968 RepID=UPI001663A105|nr:hypothetical protein [Leuconostoc pseudomesenteroides]WAM38729.1 hypothetical protein OYT93_00695 [Leuconostoc pseudomesenteroides]
MEELFGMILVFSDTLFDVDDDKPFGFRFWLALVVWAVTVCAFVIALYMFIIFVPSLFNHPLTQFWCVCVGIEVLFGGVSYFLGWRTVIWALQIKNNIQAHSSHQHHN